MKERYSGLLEVFVKEDSLYYFWRDEENPESHFLRKLPAVIEPDKINTLVDQCLKNLAGLVVSEKHL